VHVVRIADAVRLQTSSSMTWAYLEVESSELDMLGPSIDNLVVHTNTIGATASHAWKVVTWWSVDGRTWNGPTDLFTAIVAGSGAAIQAAFATTSAFGLRMRYGLAFRNNAGTAAETAVVDAWLQITFKS
jgi:hypothetical protein